PFCRGDRGVLSYLDFTLLSLTYFHNVLSTIFFEFRKCASLLKYFSLQKNVIVIIFCIEIFHFLLCIACSLSWYPKNFRYCRKKERRGRIMKQTEETVGEKAYLAAMKGLWETTLRVKAEIPEDNHYRSMLDSDLEERAIIEHISKALHVAAKYDANIDDRLDVGLVLLMELCFKVIGLNIMEMIESPQVEQSQETGYETILASLNKLMEELEAEEAALKERMRKLEGVDAAYFLKKVRAGKEAAKDDEDILRCEYGLCMRIQGVFEGACRLLGACEESISMPVGDLLGAILAQCLSSDKFD
ncbi:MAG: hypothetical protein ACM3KR_01725, partial [Deltaproteobacteria bacterium]